MLTIFGPIHNSNTELFNRLFQWENWRNIDWYNWLATLGCTEIRACA